ncbi:MAG: hypothetical protein V4695_12240 [Pseudomonadota bacterium]
MKLSLPSLTNCFESAPKPFDEMKLSKAEVKQKVAELKTNGFFSIPISETTQRYLHNTNQGKGNSESQWEAKSTGTELKLPKSYNEIATRMATAVISKVADQKVHLETQEFQIRRPGLTPADRWHQDRNPKVLTCLATLEGRGTEYVTPALARATFKHIDDKITPIEMRKGRILCKEDIKTFKKDNFYFIASRSDVTESIPKLVHRAPAYDHKELSERAIFLSRWRPV